MSKGNAAPVRRRKFAGKGRRAILRTIASAYGTVRRRPCVVLPEAVVLERQNALRNDDITAFDLNGMIAIPEQLD